MLMNKTSYTTHEYIHKTKKYGDIIITAYVENETKLSVWLKTTENTGISHFVVGYEIKAGTSIDKEIKGMSASGYFDIPIETSLDTEDILENREEQEEPYDNSGTVTMGLDRYNDLKGMSDFYTEKFLNLRIKIFNCIVSQDDKITGFAYLDMINELNIIYKEENAKRERFICNDCKRNMCESEEE